MTLIVVRILPFARGYGRSSCKWIRSMLLRTSVTSAKGPVQCVKRFETIHSGMSALPLSVPCSTLTPFSNLHRTLATDSNFKSRVREDMLVRLLDAFVWRSTEAMESISPTSPTFPHLPATYGRSRQPQQPKQPLAFNYVQGMNVLAAPFLYTMPTEVEAFYSFARFIERACPLYVQPTLEGVHRGLKVRITYVYRTLSITNH
jgi:hypothetical protein